MLDPRILKVLLFCWFILRPVSVLVSSFNLHHIHDISVVLALKSKTLKFDYKTSTYCFLNLRRPSKGACTRLWEIILLLARNADYLSLPVGEDKRVAPQKEHKHQDQDILGDKGRLRKEAVYVMLILCLCLNYMFCFFNSKCCWNLFPFSNMHKLCLMRLRTNSS